MKKKQVLIASEQFLSRLGIKTLLSVVGLDFDIQETYSFNGIKTISNEGNSFDYIILSDSIIPSPGNMSILDLRKKFPSCKFMIIGDHIIDNCVCDQYVLNCYKPKLVLEKFQIFFYQTPEKTRKIESSFLSDREVEVLKTLALGFSNKIIADKLCISVNTVVTHRKNITSKLGIKSISGLTVYALIHNIIQAEDVK